MMLYQGYFTTTVKMHCFLYLIISITCALPNSIRYREIPWDRSTALGRYTATLTLNRGYASTTDEMTISFWIIPWKVMGIVILIILILVALVYFFRSNFELKRKK